MKKLLMASLCAATLTLQPLAVFAVEAPSTTQASDATTTTEETRAELKQRNQATREALQERRELVRKKAEEQKAMLEQKRAERKQQAMEKRQEVRADICKKQQTFLNDRLPKLTQKATNIQDAIDKANQRVMAFYEKHDLSFEGDTAALESLQLKKAEVANHITALKASQPTVDCEDTTLGAALQLHRTNIAETKTSLKSYRDELKAFVASLRTALKEAKAAKKTDAKTSDGATQTPASNQ